MKILYKAKSIFNAAAEFRLLMDDFSRQAQWSKR